MDADVGLWRGKESQNLAHQPLSLIRLKNEVRMGGAFQDYQLFRARRFLVLRANSGKPESCVVGIVASQDEQLSAFHQFGFINRGVRQQHQAVYLAWLS